MTLPLASRRRRLIAMLLDHFILMVLTVLPFPILLNMADTPEAFVPFLLLDIFVALAALILKDAAFQGASPGKYIMGIAVRSHGTPDQVPSLARLALRNLGLMIWPVEAIVLLCSSDKRRLGDRWADTSVYRTGNMKKLAALLVIVLGVGAFWTALTLTITHSPAYAAATHFLTTDPSIRNQLGDVQRLEHYTASESRIEVENGYGHAVFGIWAYGTKGKALFVLTLAKKPNSEWTVVSNVRQDQDPETNEPQESKP